MSNLHQLGASMLDCTLRDGAHVNKGSFGPDRVANIIKALDKAKIDTIELGFLTDIGNWVAGNTLFNTLEQVEQAIPDGLNSQISLMIRPDQCEIEKLDRKLDKVDVVRFAFHEKNLALTEKYIDKALSLGYEVCANPVNVMSYTQAELKDVLVALQAHQLSTISVVDTFGSMKHNEFIQYCEMFDQYLNENVKLGLHLHENFSQTFGLICTAFNVIPEKRKLVVDGSLMGMGRIPGNLCTEIMVSHFNSLETRYNMSPLLKVISEEIVPEREKNMWGYSPIYMLTAERNMHRSYGEFLDKQDVPLDRAELILNNIVKSGRVESYDETLVKGEMNCVLRGERG